MRLSELQKQIDGKGGACRILGTGPSARLFDVPGMFTIGINNAHKLSKCDLSLTFHPELVDESAETVWVIKRGEPPLNVTYGHPKHIAFEAAKVAKVKDPVKALAAVGDETLFMAHGTHCSAMHLAYKLGFRTIFLHGIDLNIIANEHHSLDQHTMYRGLPPDQVTFEYYDHGAFVRDWIIKNGGQVITLSPYLGFGRESLDHLRLLKVKGLDYLPKPKDIPASNGKIREKISPAPTLS